MCRVGVDGTFSLSRDDATTLEARPRMTDPGWTFETLLTNGWYAHDPAGAPGVLRFTYYRSEISIHTVTGHGATRAEAIADAVRQANAWLSEHPGYQPLQPWIRRHDQPNERA